MKRDNLPWRPLQPAALTWGPVPASTAYDDVYFSGDNGLAESLHVFLEGNGLPGRLQQHPHRDFCVAETGFGTGLNFLLTWRAWRQAAGQVPDLHYLSIEKHPLTRADLARALGLWPALDELAQALLAVYPEPVPGQHRLLLDEGRVRLDLWWEDAADALADLASRRQPLVDAWYLDGFAPARNREMWSEELLAAAAALARPGATVSTFTVAGHVRRSLQAAGFRVDKVPGYGRKRECLRGTLQRAEPRPSPAQYPQDWDLGGDRPGAPRSALVLGAGLAGCSVALALARRGVAVTVVDRGGPGGAIRALDQGILFTRVSRKHSAQSDFALQCFLFAARFYRDLFARGGLTAPRDGELTGSFQQSDNGAELRELAAAFSGLDDLVRVLDAPEASGLLGIEQPCGGLWFPQSGWLQPAAVCNALLGHPGIRLVQDCGDLVLEAAGARWRAVSGAGTVAEAECAVAAPGADLAGLAPFQWLPAQVIRGQVSRVPAAGALAGLRAPLCHDGYIAPAREGVHCVGATYDIGDTGPEARDADHRRNLERLAAALPACRDALQALDARGLEGAVGLRCASPDYLPMVGPAPDLQGFLQRYAPLGRDARHPVPGPGCYLPGLYLTTAHGSRGLTSAPLAGELLASMVCGEPPPLSRSLCRALAPARFIIRDLIRNRIKAP